MVLTAMTPGFNIRVYGIWLHEGQLLLSEEQIGNRLVVKFPGGGLIWGEGLADCLIREWEEELGLAITVREHFYTTDFFQASAFDHSQVISIYYFVEVKDLPEKITNRIVGERIFQLPLEAVSANVFSLPIDQKVGALLQQWSISSRQT